MKILSGLMSKWTRPMVCMYCRPYSEWVWGECVDRALAVMVAITHKDSETH